MITEYKFRKLRKHLRAEIARWREERRSHIEQFHPRYETQGPSRSCGWCRTTRHTLGALETVARIAGVQP